MKLWYLCYHSMKYPIITFIHLDDISKTVEESIRVESFYDPSANSTQVHLSPPNVSIQSPRLTRSLPDGFSPKTVSIIVHSADQTEDLENSVGHMSHIPRTPPSPSTYTIPSIINQSNDTEFDPEEDLFGMIKLKQNDVCYTSGKIEWVGRKRSFPINSGFKIISENHLHGNESTLKKVKRLDKTFTNKVGKIKECDCADVLPTVNAIVDHLNALHEAVDLVDLRLNNLEGVGNI